MGSLRKAHAMNVVDATNRPKRKLRRRRRPITKTLLIKAIRGSLGTKSSIADAAGISLTSVLRLLDDPEWADVREIYEEEKVRLADTGKRGLVQCATQGVHLPTKLGACKELVKLDDDFKDVKTVKIEGGDRPVQIQQLKLISIIDDLNLPLEVRKAMLDKVRGGLENDEEVKAVPENNNKGVL